MQRQSEVIASLETSGHTLHNEAKSDAAGRLSEGARVKAAGEEPMEIGRRKAELARTRRERDILKKRRRILRGDRGETRLHRTAEAGLAGRRTVPRTGGVGERLPASRTRRSGRLSRRLANACPIWRWRPISAPRSRLANKTTAGRAWSGRLRTEGLWVGKAMESNDILVRSRRRLKVAPDIRRDLPIARNLLNREFATQAPTRLQGET